MTVACEKMVRYVLPWIRKEFAIIMVNELKLSQVKVAKKLKVTEPAISQYLSSKRGDEIKIFDEKIVIAVREAAIRISDDNSGLSREICQICRLIRISNAIPDVYRPKVGAVEEFDECVCDTFE